MRKLIEHFDFAGIVLALIALFVFGAAESKASWGLRVLSLALLSLGLFMMAVHAIVEKEVRFGVRLMSSHVGIRAQLMGGIYLVLAVAVAAGAMREVLAPGTLIDYTTSRAGAPIVVLVLAACFALGGAAMLFGKSYGRGAASGCMVIPQRIFGFIVLTLGIITIIGAVMEIIAPGRVFAILQSFLQKGAS